MKFGRQESDIRVQPLPPDHWLTTALLSKRTSTKKAKIYVGCPVWSDPKMVGRLYPKGTKASDYLRLYSREFSGIELNVTGRSIPDIPRVREWVSQVPADFRFFPKVSLQVSGTAPLGKNRAAVERLFASLHEFGKHYGAAFMLLPALAPKRMEDLLSFIDAWDKDLKLHIELRHKEWFADPETLNTLLLHMKKRKIGTVITDVTARRDVLHQALTTPDAFIRFDAHDLDPTDFLRLDQWVDKTSEWIYNGLRELYFFVHTTEKYLNPELAKYFIDRMRNQTMQALHSPTLQTPGR